MAMVINFGAKLVATTLLIILIRLDISDSSGTSYRVGKERSRLFLHECQGGSENLVQNCKSSLKSVGLFESIEEQHSPPPSVLPLLLPPAAPHGQIANPNPQYRSLPPSSLPSVLPLLPPAAPQGQIANPNPHQRLPRLGAPPHHGDYEKPYPRPRPPTPRHG